jgi:hypothetical protein
MSTFLKKHFYIGIFLAIVFALAIVITANASTIIFSYTKNYHSVTNVYHSTNITYNGGIGFYTNVNDFTQPIRFMDQFGYSYWTTYIECNGSIIWSTVYQFSSSYANNVSTFKLPKDRNMYIGYWCVPNQTMHAHSIVAHWWQDSPYQGDGNDIDAWYNIPH